VSAISNGGGARVMVDYFKNHFTSTPWKRPRLDEV